jgi:hypothetical protein
MYKMHNSMSKVTPECFNSKPPTSTSIRGYDYSSEGVLYRLKCLFGSCAYMICLEVFVNLLDC